MRNILDKNWGFHWGHNFIQIWTPWFYFNASNWYQMPHSDNYEIGTILAVHKYNNTFDIFAIWNTLHYVTGQQIVENRWNLGSKGA